MKSIKFTEALINSDNLVERYYNLLLSSEELFSSTIKNGFSGYPNTFDPDFKIPALDEKLISFLEPTKASIVSIGKYKGREISLFNLMKNPETNTVKTFAATLLIARAVSHIREKHEKIIVFSPSSGNKAIALRDAVLRAIKCDLVSPEELRIITLTPKDTKEKLRVSELSSDKYLKNLNPAFVLDTDSPEKVKDIGNKFKERFNDKNKSHTKLWHSLKLENYRFADQIRAFYDYEFGELENNKCVHVHSVSSAYGFLGYKTGVDRLNDLGCKTQMPAFLLVQHLATSDMVDFLLTGSFESPKNIYSLSKDGYYHQSNLKNYPFRTSSIKEILEQTFYSHKPATVHEMTDIINTYGGNGVVVSLLECLERYALIREMLCNAGVSLVADAKNVKEWSLIMALTGAMNAIDRNLIREDMSNFVIHGTGYYSSCDYESLGPDDYISVMNEVQMMNYI
ncbi:DUF6002 family protein [Pantoea sp. At-9b]|uniref:DUF6002 family protein n=1 Tax=Pantoea sp. (strain At-9b) TaxID=592316 RepID=UPI0001B3E887|nr:DUF6002 family protein [Pantoea sp. At-9b]ADU68027.1 conserved hypothetical protein [Pantoea sp. At-9b]